VPTLDVIPKPENISARPPKLAVFENTGDGVLIAAKLFGTVGFDRPLMPAMLFKGGIGADVVSIGPLI
jgi:hypothetical protein